MYFSSEFDEIFRLWSSPNDSNSEQPVSSSNRHSEKRALSPEETYAEAGSSSRIVSDLPPPAKRAKSKNPPLDDPPRVYIGNFDLYAMSLPFLLKIYLPDPASPPQFEALYHKLLALQAKPDFTARCYLAPPPDAPDATAAITGRFENPTMIDPTLGCPFDVVIHSIDNKRGMAIRAHDRRFFPAYEFMPPGPGISGRTALAREQEGIRASSGAFKMKRVWIKTASAREELFEGLFSFKVVYDEMHKHSGFGSSDSYKYGFWAIRALQDEEGRDIGLGP